MNYYVYELIDPRTVQTFYVGAGSGSNTHKRLLDHLGEAKSGKSTNDDKCTTIRQLIAEGLMPGITVHECVDQTHSTTLEKQLIKQHGMKKDGGILTNRHPGGGGIRGAGRAGNKNGRLPPRPVYQFDLNGMLIRCWPAITQAARGIGVSHTAIINACKGLHSTKTVGGFRWSYNDQQLDPLVKSQPALKRIYKQFDLEGNYIATWATGVDIKRQLGIDNSTILKHLKGKIRHAGGFLWSRELLNP